MNKAFKFWKPHNENGMNIPHIHSELSNRSSMSQMHIPRYGLRNITLVVAIKEVIHIIQFLFLDICLIINSLECFFGIEDHAALDRIRDRDTIPFSYD